MAPETGAATLSLEQGGGSPERALDIAMAALERFSRRAPVAVVLEEFQEIAAYAQSGFEKRLRRHIQGHADIAYVFCGSQRHLPTNLFTAVRQFDNDLYSTGRRIGCMATVLEAM